MEHASQVLRNSYSSLTSLVFCRGGASVWVEGRRVVAIGLMRVGRFLIRHPLTSHLKSVDVIDLGAKAPKTTTTKIIKPYRKIELKLEDKMPGHLVFQIQFKFLKKKKNTYLINPFQFAFNCHTSPGLCWVPFHLVSRFVLVTILFSTYHCVYFAGEKTEAERV